jgi:hypothetical protein
MYVVLSVCAMLSLSVHQLLGDIVAGVSQSPHAAAAAATAHQHRYLLVNVLLPLHSPNQMLEWRDQIPVLQPYHESLVRCLVRLVQWDQAAHRDRDTRLESTIGGEDRDEGQDQAVYFSTSTSLLSPWQEEGEREGAADGVSSAPPVHPQQHKEQQHKEQRQHKGQQRQAAGGRADSGSRGRESGGSLLVTAVRALLESLWPEGFNTNTPKEVLLLHEVGGRLLLLLCLHLLSCIHTVHAADSGCFLCVLQPSFLLLSASPRSCSESISLYYFVVVRVSLSLSLSLCLSLSVFEQVETLLELASPEEFSELLDPVLVSSSSSSGGGGECI